MRRAASGFVATSGAGSVTTTRVPPPKSVAVATFSPISAAEVGGAGQAEPIQRRSVARQPSGEPSGAWLTP
jgi:hypothetical protein